MGQAWHDDDQMWATVGPLMFTPQRWAEAPAEVERVIALLGLQPPAAVLDLGCGVGRHSLELARRGFRVTGVDRTAIYVEEARQRAAAEELDLELLVGDMREFARDASFDAALSMRRKSLSVRRALYSGSGGSTKGRNRTPLTSTTAPGERNAW